ncbi:hypothetical protein QAD02_021084 [Eretmocerus hayati]|uniref:Uncharacterized protein n=1 Tax=Eretmocerus hayati TaxID=131215 RepID=A0ACC2PQL5_9HYME|nr:hypothetical protein QAD02_021084 [Eretmocerus hayati]
MVLRIAPRDDDRPGKGKSAELDLVQQNRTVGDRNAAISRIVLQVDDSQRMTSSRATPMDSPARTATIDDDWPVKDRNASSDLEQHNRTVKDRRAVGRRVISLVGHSRRIT